MKNQPHLVSGTLFALAAGLMWGLVFVVPLLLPDYPAALLSVSRYLAFGLIALPLAAFDAAALRSLSGADWLEALKLSLVGNLLYYACLAGAIQRAGAPLPTMLIGTLPVIIALVSNRRNAQRDGRLPWRRLGPSLLLMACGIALVNHAEWQAFNAQLPLNANLNAHAQANPIVSASDQTTAYLSGALLALGAVACWTWYPIRNADWLRAHGNRPPRIWATAQGLVTLPIAALGFAAFWFWNQQQGSPLAAPLGPTPGRFVALMLTLGLLASWLGTLCWNEASQRLPTALAGQLIVFETLSALAYAYLLRGQWPEAATAFGVGLLVAGVVWALKPSRAAASGPTGAAEFRS